MAQITFTRRRVLVGASLGLAVVVLFAAAAVGGSYFLALSALHNKSNLSVTQACAHWGWMYQASAEDRDWATHAADARTLAQLGCTK